MELIHYTGKLKLISKVSWKQEKNILHKSYRVSTNASNGNTHLIFGNKYGAALKVNFKIFNGNLFLNSMLTTVMIGIGGDTLTSAGNTLLACCSVWHLWW